MRMRKEWPNSENSMNSPWTMTQIHIRARQTVIESKLYSSWRDSHRAQLHLVAIPLFLQSLVFGNFTPKSLFWIADTTFYRDSQRISLYKAGLIFPMILTALSGIWAIIAWWITL